MPVQVATCRHGRFLVLDNDVYIGRLLLRDGVYSEPEVDLFAKLLQPGNVVVEAGANIGAHTVPLAKLVGPAGRVVAFEPQQVIYRLLCGNLALNDCRNVDAYPAGLGSDQTPLRLPKIDYDAMLNFGGVPLRSDWVEPGDMVGVFVLDRLELPALHLLKADVEGMEVAVINGARKTIEGFRPYLYIEDNDTDPQPRRDLLAGLGYRVVEHHVPLLGPDDPLNPFPGCIVVSKNLLGVPQERPDPE